MATSRVWLILLLCAGSAWSRNAATPSECQIAASQPALSRALTQVAGNPDDVRAQITLADAWSDAGCYNDAVTVLQTALVTHPAIPELQTRLRVATSLVGEEHFFDDLERADEKARLKRDIFRCESLADQAACSDAVRMKPEDPALLSAIGDAQLRAKRPAEALQDYRRAEALATDKQTLADKIREAESELPSVTTVASTSVTTTTNIARAAPSSEPRHYSNVSPDGQSH